METSPTHEDDRSDCRQTSALGDCTRQLAVLDSDPLVVLQGVRAPGPGANPFSAMSLTCLPGNIVAVPFSWRRALFGKYDVFHLHWPEALTRGSGVRGFAKKALTTLLLARLWILRTAVVRTIHNLKPHEYEGVVERVLRTKFDRLTSVWISQ